MANCDNPNYMDGNNNLPLPNSSNRCKYVVSSVTTFLQSQTEDECCPFFVDIPTLPKSQIDHLRQVGLLPSVANSLTSSMSTQEGDRGYEDIVDITDLLDKRVIDVSDRKNMSNCNDNNKGKRLLNESKCLVSTDTSSTLNKDVTTNNGQDNSSNDYIKKKLQNEEDEKYDICLLRSKHIAYCKNALTNPLPSSYISLDAARPWMIYWNLHSLDLLNALPSPHDLINIVRQLELCWEEFPIPNGKERKGEMKMAGGYGGGPGQMAHGATTYAAVLALCIIAGCGNSSEYDTKASKKGFQQNQKKIKEYTYNDAANYARSVIVYIRPKLYEFFYLLRTPISSKQNHMRGAKKRQDNLVGFSMHIDGENDVRGTYTVIAISHLLQILTPELIHNVSNYIISCQTYEGGFGGEPMGTEAHGGYTFCAVAALSLLNDLRKVKDRSNLLSWLAKRQMEYEGGFSGRSNKLVDGCYSFWIGGTSALIMLEGLIYGECNGSIMQSIALERYLLLCGQCVDGGMRDKPSKPRDFYHTCYCLSGLSTAQHYGKSKPSRNGSKGSENKIIFGHSNNLLQKTDPYFNILVQRVENLKAFLHVNNIKS